MNSNQARLCLTPLHLVAVSAVISAVAESASPVRNERYADTVIGDRADDFNGLEIQGVREDGTAADSDRACVVVDNENPQFFSVYARARPDGENPGVVCIGDFGTHALARVYAEEIARKHEIAIIHDSVPAVRQQQKAYPVDTPLAFRETDYRVSAYTGTNHGIGVEMKIRATSAHSAAQVFAAEFGETVYPGRTERPTDGRGVTSYGWTGHGQRVFVTEQ